MFRIWDGYFWQRFEPANQQFNEIFYILDDEGSELGGLMACSAITHTSDANSEGTESSQSQQVKACSCAIDCFDWLEKK